MFESTWKNNMPFTPNEWTDIETETADKFDKFDDDELHTQVVSEGKILDTARIEEDKRKKEKRKKEEERKKESKRNVEEEEVPLKLKKKGGGGGGLGLPQNSNAKNNRIKPDPVAPWNHVLGQLGDSIRMDNESTAVQDALTLKAAFDTTHASNQLQLLEKFKTEHAADIIRHPQVSEIFENIR